MQQQAGRKTILKKIDNYYMNPDEVLGKGSFSTVYKGVDIQTNNPVAIKTLGLNENDCKLEMFRKEVRNLQLIDHENVVRLIDVKKSSSNLYLIMEYCNGGNLERILQNNHGRLVEDDALKIFQNVIDVNCWKTSSQLAKQGHEMPFLKPNANILIHNYMAKIADFGFSKLINENNEMLFSIVGTPQYMSPQLLKGNPYTSKTDIWSLGIVFYQMLYGKPPYSGQNNQQLYENMLSQPLYFPEVPRISHAVKELVKQMIVVEEEKRISWEYLFNSDLISDKHEEQVKTSLELLSKIDNNQLKKTKGLVKLFFEQNKIVTSSYECLRREALNKMIVKEHLNNCNAEEDKEIKSLTQRIEELEIQKLSLSEFEIKQLFEYHRVQQENFTILSQISSYLLHRRNKAIFFYLASIQIYELLDETQDLVQMEYHLIIRIAFLLMKYAVLKLFRVYKRLKSNSPQNYNKFNMKSWEIFMKSEQRTHLLRFISSDFELGQIFFDRFTQYSKNYLTNLRDSLQQSTSNYQNQKSSELENESGEFICLLQPPNLLLQSFDQQFQFDDSQLQNKNQNTLELYEMLNSFLCHCSKKIRPKDQFNMLIQSTIQLGLAQLYFVKDPSKDLLQSFFRVYFSRFISQMKCLLQEWKQFTQIKINQENEIWSKFYENIDSMSREQLYQKLIGFK